jgi:DNA-directed RNA polymerase subunit RPC12/RpoP
MDRTPNEHGILNTGVTYKGSQIIIWPYAGEHTGPHAQLGVYCEAFYKPLNMTYQCLNCGKDMQLPWGHGFTEDEQLELYYGFCGDCSLEAQRKGKYVRG